MQPENSNGIRIIGLGSIPRIKPGDNLPSIIVSAIEKHKLKLEGGEAIVVTHKIVSKAEGRIVKLTDVKPSFFALEVAKQVGKDPRVVELILSESRRIVKMLGNSLITETRHGFICANSGVDQSNVEEGTASLLPLDSDKSAKQIREAVKKRFGIDVAVVITDTFGRPWREGQTDIAIGVSGMEPILDYRGKNDPYGYELRVTAIAVADELAGAAELVKGKNQETPVAVVKGYRYPAGEGSVKSLIREPSKDLFR